MEEKTNDISESLPAILTSEKLLSIADQAEKRVQALNKIKLVALQTTNAKDWTDHQGKPWLQESGATKVARLFGIGWTMSEPTRENFENGHFQYSFAGIFKLADIEIEGIGSRQSNDGFFNTRYKWNNEEKKMKSYEVPPTEIDAGDVRKAAFANCLGRGIVTILGIKNLTWEEIEENTKIKRDQVTSIQYGKDKDKAPSQSGKKGLRINDKDKGKDTPPTKTDDDERLSGKTREVDETRSQDSKIVPPVQKEEKQVLDTTEKQLRAKFKRFAKADNEKYFEIMGLHGCENASEAITSFTQETRENLIKDLEKNILVS